MEIWDAREHASQKILFLFAVNAHKHFCGVAEMSGPWDPEGAVSVWEEGDKGAASVG